MVENLEIVFRCVSMAAFAVFGVDGSHEGDELVGDNDIHVSILDLLIVLVFFVVKSV